MNDNMPGSLTQSLKSTAKELGFELAAACPAVDASGYSNFVRWLESGFAGEMSYLESRREAYRHPNSVMDGCQSILMLASSYFDGDQRTVYPPGELAAIPVSAGQGRVARYCWGPQDYHDTLHGRLKKLKQAAESQAPGIRARGVVDTAPLLEREFAQLAGLGWVGKNTLLLNRRLGSWFFLAALLINVELDYDTPMAQDHCGTCDACIQACPTQAFVQPRVLDASRCISYLTIEHRSQIPVSLRNDMGDWLFGCDVCQDVCPWNNKAETAATDALLADEAQPESMDLRQLFELDDIQFRQRFRKTPLWRIRRRGLLRNAAIVLGNQRDSANIPALRQGLRDPEPLVREACAWALGQFQCAETQELLREQLSIESEQSVREEILGLLHE